MNKTTDETVAGVSSGGSSDTKDTKNATVKEGLSGRIGRTFVKILRRALIIVCLESILIGSCFAVLYTLQNNRGSVTEYAEKIMRQVPGRIRPSASSSINVPTASIRWRIPLF